MLVPSIEDKNLLDLIRNTLNAFCSDFIQNPYMCYTEHGQHALFYNMLLNAMPEHKRYITFESKKVCVLQKEYTTADKLDKSKRQHWDIAILKEPVSTTSTPSHDYDHLPLFAVIEFGMNETEEHLKEDIRRLCHQKSIVDHPFIVHLYRLSESGNLFSHRDWSSKSPRILNPDRVGAIKGNNPVEVFYARADSTGIKNNEFCSF